MLLFFTGAVVVLGRLRLKTLEDGHGILTQRAWEDWGGPLPPAIRLEQIILGNLRADIPALTPQHTVSLVGLGLALVRAQTLPKYAHGMRQPWHHPTRHLAKVQAAFYEKTLSSLTQPNPDQAAESLGAALHTLQDSYTLGHTERENNADIFSPLCRLHYSPSRVHPFISPNDRVWADASATVLTPEAQAACQATRIFLAGWSARWPCSAAQAQPFLSEFINTYLPIRGQPFMA